MNESLNHAQYILFLKVQNQRHFHRVNKTFRMSVFQRSLAEKTTHFMLNIKFPHEGSLLHDLNVLVC